MIYKPGKRWRVIVYAGRDPHHRPQAPEEHHRRHPRRGQAGRGPLITEVGAGQHRASANRTVAELLDRWLDWRQSVRPISPTTVATYRGYIDRSIRPTLGKLLARPAGCRHPGRLLRPPAQAGRQGGRPMAASSVHQVHAHPLGRSTGWWWGWIASNPARLASPPRSNEPISNPGSRGRRPPAQRGAGRGPRAGPVPAPGGRARRPPRRAVRGSLVGRRPGPGRGPDRGRIVRVPGESLVDKATKTHAKRRVAIGADTAELLRAHRLTQAKGALACGTALAADAFVFSHAPDGSAPINPDGITHRFRRLARRLGVGCRLHDLRHFMVTQLVAGGVDWRTVAGRAGHADGHMTLGTYAHFQQAQDRQAAEFMDRLLAAPGTNSR